MLIGGGHALDPRVGPFGKQVQEQERTQRLAGAHFFGARVGEEAREPGEAIGFHKDIEQVQHAIALADEVFDPAQALGFGLGRQARPPQTAGDPHWPLGS